MSTLIDVVLPADQTEGTTNVVGTWFKRVGDAVAAHEPLLEITTDKVTVEISAPAAGVLAEILKAEGDDVEPGAVVGRIGPADATQPGKAAPTPAARTAEFRPPSDSGAKPEIRLTPVVRRMVEEHGIDPATIEGSGRGGRITAEDVERHLAGQTGGPERAAAEAGVGPASAAGRRVPHTQMRKLVAAHMVKSVATAPHVTSVFEADLSAIVAHRASHQADYETRGARLTFTAYFVRASVAALQAVPDVNSRWRDDALELFDDCNIGVGTALESGGLIVPVVPRAQTLDLFETARLLGDLTSRARAGTLQPKEVQGGTFTISNHGVSGSLVATPIVINQPQSAILGVGKLQRRAMVDAGDGVVVKPMAYVTLTIDHRVLDGFQANAFLTTWVETIEGWI
jgi:2-oxoglutarate dehydrogenase E2 component (dihydrolipoamide succinyltransferase)